MKSFAYELGVKCAQDMLHDGMQMGSDEMYPGGRKKKKGPSLASIGLPLGMTMAAPALSRMDSAPRSPRERLRRRNKRRARQPTAGPDEHGAS